MLFVYHGKNIIHRRQALQKLRDGLLEKRSDAEVFEFDSDTFSINQIEELTAGRGLFEGKYIVFLFHVLSTNDGEEALLERLDILKSAQHIFILVEDSVSSKQLKKIKPHAEAVQEFTKEASKKEYKPFPLSDAYGRRDKRTAWIELQKARNAKELAESIHGVLAWQTRLMLLAKKYDTAEAASESGYPFKKAKGFSRNFSEDELRKNFRRLVKSYHEAHRGQYHLYDAVEQFLLEL